MVLNAAHVHLMVNHYAIFAAFFASALLAYGMVVPVRPLRVAAYVLLLSGAAVVIISYVSGSMSEDALEHIPGVLESAIEAHEEAARISLAFSLLAGISALFAVFREARSAQPQRFVQATTLIFSIAAFGAGGYAALLGGEIHHPEIRSAESGKHFPLFSLVEQA